MTERLMIWRAIAMQYSVPRCENPVDFLPAVSALENPKLVEDYFQEVMTAYGGTYV